MAPIFPLIALASGLAFQTPATPTAPTPTEAPLPTKGKAARGVDSELARDVQEDGVMSFARYEGGSLTLKPNKLTTYVNQREIVLVQGKQRVAIPVQAVAAILDGDAAPARVGATTGSAILSTGMKNQSAGNLTVVGIVWADPQKKNGVVLRVDKGDFTAFLAALESVTGLKAIYTDPKSH